MHDGYCEAVSAGGMVVAACQHGRCTDTVNDIASPALAAAVAGIPAHHLPTPFQPTKLEY